jgi:hypothetical protein
MLAANKNHAPGDSMLPRRLLLATLLCCAMGAQAAQPAPQCTTRDCLIKLADDYVAALVAHDPWRLPFSVSVRFVENIEQKRLGEGLWKTASGGLTKFRIYVPDPVSGTVGLMGMMEEDGKPLMIGLRLKVFEGEIVEVEHVLARNINARNLTFLQTPRAIFSTKVAKPMPRWQMLGVAHSYYEAIDYNDGFLSPMDKDCERRENGSPSSADRAPPPPNAEVPYWSALECTPQFNTNMMAYIDSIDNVRVVAVDQVNGLVFAFSHFRHGMRNKATPIRNTPGVTSRTVNASAFDLPAAHVFKISGGKLHQIEAMGFRADYMSPTGW